MLQRLLHCYDRLRQIIVYSTRCKYPKSTSNMGIVAFITYNKNDSQKVGTVFQTSCENDRKFKVSLK